MSGAACHDHGLSCRAVADNTAFNPMDTPSRRKWNPEEDRILLVMINTGRPRADIAKRFDTTEDEIARRFAEIAEQMEKQEKESGAQPPNLKDMDGVIVAFTQVCSIYNDLGNAMIPLSEMLSSQLKEEELLHELLQIIAYIRTRVPPQVPITPPMIVKQLHKHFVVLRRPQVTVQEAPSTDGVN